MRSNRVVRLQHAKPSHRCWNANSRKARVTGRGEWSAVVHRCTNRNTCRHLVVQQSADFCSQDFLDQNVISIITASRVAVDATGQIAFQQFTDLNHLFDRISDDKQRSVPKRLGLEHMRIREELAARNTHQSILEANSLSAAGLTTGDQ